MQVIRKLNPCELQNALDLANCTLHIHERASRLARSGLGIGCVGAGFLVDKGHENGLEEHFITNTGLIIVRNHNTRKAVTILIARPMQVKRYYDALGYSVPSRFLQLAYRNTRIYKLNY